jgi:hypothetical protein
MCIDDNDVLVQQEYELLIKTQRYEMDINTNAKLKDNEQRQLYQESLFGRITTSYRIIITVLIKVFIAGNAISNA